MPDDKWYHLLGVPVGASEIEIKKAYRKQALLWHPDKNPGEEATTRFQEISQAYKRLVGEEESDDENFFEGFDPHEFFKQAFAHANFFNRKNPFDFNQDFFEDFDDDFEDYEEDDDDDDDDNFEFLFQGMPPGGRFPSFRPKRDFFGPSKVFTPTPEPPSIVQGPVRCVSATETTLELIWDPPTGECSVKHYTLEIDKSKVPGANFEEIYKGKKNTFTVSNLQPGKTFHFLVRGVDKTGELPFSPVASLKTNPRMKKQPQPNNPANAETQTPKQPQPKNTPKQPQANNNNNNTERPVDQQPAKPKPKPKAGPKKAKPKRKK